MKQKPRLADLTPEEREAEYQQAYEAVARFVFSSMQREQAAEQQAKQHAKQKTA
jgi:hypothetical protein